MHVNYDSIFVVIPYFGYIIFLILYNIIHDLKISIFDCYSYSSCLAFIVCTITSLGYIIDIIRDYLYFLFFYFLFYPLFIRSTHPIIGII